MGNGCVDGRLWEMTGGGGISRGLFWRRSERRLCVQAAEVFLVSKGEGRRLSLENGEKIGSAAG